MTYSNLKWLGRQLLKHYTMGPDWEQYRYIVTMDLGYEEQITGMRERRWSNMEIWMRMLCEHIFIAPYWIIRQHFCRHSRWVDEGYGNPDSGGDGGHCPDCHFAFWHTYY